MSLENAVPYLHLICASHLAALIRMISGHEAGMLLLHLAFLQGAQSIVAARGVKGLYNGLLPTLLRDVPELTLQFQLYESLRYAMQHHGKVTEQTPSMSRVKQKCSCQIAFTLFCSRYQYVRRMKSKVYLVTADSKRLASNSACRL